MKKKYESKILQAIHEDAEGMHRLGLISDERMRFYDEGCLVHEPKPKYEPVSFPAESTSARQEAVTRISAKGAV